MKDYEIQAGILKDRLLEKGYDPESLESTYNEEHSVSSHYDQHHERNPEGTLFIGIDKFEPHWRGSSLVRELSRMEMAWIYRVRTYSPYGLNIDTDVNAFIDNG